MAELTVISWRAIPAQVVAREGRETARVQLSDRFQQAIDAAAMKAGLSESDAYLEEWTRTSRPCGVDLEAEVAAEAEALEAAFPRERLAAFVRAGGIEPL
jgi:hypothetical protein